jgi:hypothetical protein
MKRSTDPWSARTRPRLGTTPRHRGIAPAESGVVPLHSKGAAERLGCGCPVFHDDAQQLCWALRQRQIIFRLLLAQFGQMIASRPKADYRGLATLWQGGVETWLRR